MNNLDVVLALISRLVLFAAHFCACEQNKHPKRMARRALPKHLRLRQSELVEAFGKKAPRELSRNTRKAIVVVTRVHKGLDSHGTIAEKAAILIARLRDFHGFCLAAPADVVVEIEAEEAWGEADKARLQELGEQASAKLAAERAAEAEAERKARETRRAEARAKADAEHRAAKEAADREAHAKLVRIYDECQALVRELNKLATERRVRIKHIEMPRLRDCSATYLARARLKLKGFRNAIEQRAIHLKRVRVDNPRALHSPLAEIRAADFGSSSKVAAA